MFKPIQIMNTIVINLMAGPGVGKSTLMAQLFARLKILGYEVEMVPEYVKEKVWDESWKVMEDAIYVFGKQLHRVNRLYGKVEVIICDSSLLNPAVYDKTENPKFADFVVDTFGKFRNMNFFLRRSTSYNVRGREQTEEEAIEVDKKFKTFLDKWEISYTEVEKDEAEFVIIAKILEILKNENRS